MSLIVKNKIQLEARGITKKIQQNLILNSINLQLREKECLGIVGDSQSGRWTLIQILSGLLNPDMGELFIQERKVISSQLFMKKTVGVIFNGDEFDENYSPYVNIVAYGCSFGFSRSESRNRAAQLFRELNIDDLKVRPLPHLERYQIKRLSLCRALVIKPEILILDDFMKGLDLAERQELKKTLLKINKNGTSLIYSSDVFSDEFSNEFSDELSEAKSLCHRVLVLKNGKIVINGKPSEVIKEHIGNEVIEVNMKTADLNYYTEKIKNQYDYFFHGDELRLFLKNGQSHMDIIKNISSKKILIRKPNLYDVYLKLGEAKVEGVLI